MNKARFASLLIGLLAIGYGWSQEQSSVYNFLKIPLSAHVAALGGENVSLSLDDPTLIYGNPAQAAQVNDLSLSLNYMSYLADTKVLGAAFTKVYSVRHTLGATAQLFSYGSMDETDEAGNVIGSFSAKDIAVSLLYSYTMGKGWAGGATMRYLHSAYGDFSSSAIAFDLGLHYRNDDNDFSFGVVMKNIGAQLSSVYEGQTEHLPFDLQAGFSSRMEHAPFRFSFTLRDLTRWSNRYYYNPEGKNSFGRKLTNHMVFGLDFLPTDKIYISAGYNCRRANELKAAGSSHGAGWSLGAGLQGERLKLGIAYSKYHVSTSSLLLNASYNL